MGSPSPVPFKEAPVIPEQGIFFLVVVVSCLFAFGEKLGRKARPGRQRDDAKTLVIVLKLYIK